MRVLVACEESQRVCTAFRDKGHEAYSCDLQECSGGHLEWHINGDALKVINPEYYDGRYGVTPSISFYTVNGDYHQFDGKWDLIIAHPPCNFMSNAGARWMYPKAGQIDDQRYRWAMQAKAFFLACLTADCEKIAVENPIPLKIVGLPTPTQKIQPYQFGHLYSKCTCLWLKGLPKLQPTNILTEYKPFLPSNTGGFSRGQGGSRGVAHNAKTASKTFEGIARAMAEQWG